MTTFPLQNPQNKRQIFCDEKLKTIFDGKAEVEFIEVAKLLSQHFVKASWILFCLDSYVTLLKRVLLGRIDPCSAVDI